MMHVQPLLRSNTSNGVTCLLVILDQRTWAIRLDGETIGTGNADENGIRDAVSAFRALLPPHRRRIRTVNRPLQPLPSTAVSPY